MKFQLKPEDHERVSNLCGPTNSTLKQIEKELKIKIINRGTKFKIDDPVGAISAHGIVGIWGIMATPLSGAGAFGTQALGALIIFSWVFITSYIVLKTLDSLVGIRASEEDEELGLDKAEIGIEAYPDFN